MWKRIVYADWAEVIPYIAFFLTFGVFLVLAVRTILMHRRQAERMANLPLEDSPETIPSQTDFSHDD